MSSIAARFINYLLTPLLTYATVVSKADYGKIGLIYSALPVLNVLFTYGFETAYFRFSSKPENRATIFSTAFLSIAISTLFFSLILYSFPSILGSITGLTDLPQLLKLSVLIIAFDTLSIIPFARLRQEERPRMYALVKISGILLNIFVTWFFISYCPSHFDPQNPNWLTLIYDPSINPVTYVLIANLLQSILTLLMLSREIAMVRLKMDGRLWREMMVYAMPLLVVGFGGVINETFDRLMLRWWLPGSENFRESQVGIYNACYKLSILITLFIQAFRMSAEPFFFKQAQGDKPQRVYARVMKFFVIVIAVMFLFVSLFLNVWQYMIGASYRVGLKIVPILLLANMFLGIYYNLSIWYKLSNKTMAGAWITLMGAGVTCLINYFFIPSYGYMACAWATFFCYGSMMVVSFIWGQKEYPVPYPWRKLVAYIVISVGLYGLYTLIEGFSGNVWVNRGIALVLLTLFAMFILRIERKEFARLPVIGKYL